MDSYLTEKQVKALRLMVQGFSIDEIANELGTSKSNVYYLIRSAKKAVERSRNTIRIYEEIVGNRRIRVRRGSEVNEVIRMMINLANEEGVKIALTTAELVRRIINAAGVSCLDVTNWVINCDLTIALGNGDLSVVSSDNV